MNELNSMFTFDRMLGILSFFITIVIYARQTKAQNEFELFSKETYALLKKQGMLTQHHLVSLRTDFLLLFHEQANNKFGFWHFKLRFEYWNELGICIKTESKTQHIDIKILGQTIDHTKEASSTDRNAYICEIEDISGEAITDFRVGEKVVCFVKGETKCISKFYHPVIEPDEYHEFSIYRLGSVVAGHKKDIAVADLPVFERVKDSIKG